MSSNFKKKTIIAIALQFLGCIVYDRLLVYIATQAKICVSNLNLLIQRLPCVNVATTPHNKEMPTSPSLKSFLLSRIFITAGFANWLLIIQLQ